jgi:hypothetical protein
MCAALPLLLLSTSEVCRVCLLCNCSSLPLLQFLCTSSSSTWDTTCSVKCLVHYSPTSPVFAAEFLFEAAHFVALFALLLTAAMYPEDHSHWCRSVSNVSDDATVKLRRRSWHGAQRAKCVQAAAFHSHVLHELRPWLACRRSQAGTLHQTFSSQQL